MRISVKLTIMHISTKLTYIKPEYRAKATRKFLIAKRPTVVFKQQILSDHYGYEAIGMGFRTNSVRLSWCFI